MEALWWCCCLRRGRQPRVEGALAFALMPALPSPVSTITLVRSFANRAAADAAPAMEKVDAVIDYICSQDAARHVRLDVRYMVTTSAAPLRVAPGLEASVKVAASAGGEAQSVEIALSSAALSLSEMRAWVDGVHRAWRREKDNTLGAQTYYFDEVPAEAVTTTDMTGPAPRVLYRWDALPKTLTFATHEFHTNKSFANVYGGHVQELKERLDLFLHKPQWYAERGIPHTLGVLLHGVAGAGKTSCIKAIAHDTRRHIFNLSLRPHTTCKQLLNLFLDERVAVAAPDGARHTYTIPLDRRIYVIEDIDALTDVTLDRGVALGRATPGGAPAGDGLTLAFLLNLLDGVLETPGRILVITSNYPERLDRALIRPGRIDVKIEFQRADAAFVGDMLRRFYDLPQPPAVPPGMGGAFTPAEVMESMCTHFKSAEAALQHLSRRLLSPAPQSTALEDVALTEGQEGLRAAHAAFTAHMASPLQGDALAESMAANEEEFADFGAPESDTTCGVVPDTEWDMPAAATGGEAVEAVEAVDAVDGL